MKTTNIDNLVNFVIAYCNINGLVVTPLKLQKILYYIQAWHIARFDRHQLFDELPEAWVNGPVYRSVYDKYKTTFFRSSPISLKKSEEDLGLILLNELDLSEDQLKVVHTLVKHYASSDEGKLVLMTHADAPWNIARQGLGDFDRCEELISVNSMFDFYNPRLNKN